MSKNKTIVGVVLAIVVIAIVFLLIISSNGPNCDLIDQEPVSDPTKVKPLKALLGNTLVEVAGYLKYNIDEKAKDPKRVFMPLNITNIQVTEVKKDNNTVNVLGMDSDCVHMGLLCVPPPSKTSTTDTVVKSILLKLTQPNLSKVDCEITSPNGLHFPKGFHYKCREERRYECSTAQSKDSSAKPKLVATLVLNLLEFEIGGTTKNVEEGKYSTPGTDKCPS